MKLIFSLAICVLLNINVYALKCKINTKPRLIGWDDTNYSSIRTTRLNKVFYDRIISIQENVQVPSRLHAEYLLLSLLEKKILDIANWYVTESPYRHPMTAKLIIIPEDHAIYMNKPPKSNVVTVMATGRDKYRKKIDQFLAPLEDMFDKNDVKYYDRPDVIEKNRPFLRTIVNQSINCQ
jgi:hypothetical protein